MLIPPVVPFDQPSTIAGRKFAAMVDARALHQGSAALEERQTRDPGSNYCILWRGGYATEYVSWGLRFETGFADSLLAKLGGPNGSPCRPGNYSQPRAYDDGTEYLWLNTDSGCGVQDMETNLQEVGLQDPKCGPPA